MSIRALWTPWLRHPRSRNLVFNQLVKNYIELASGELVEYEYGSAELEFMGEQQIPIRIIFGPDDSKPLLGVIALEMAGYIVDPKNQTIRKLRARYLKRVA